MKGRLSVRGWLCVCLLTSCAHFPSNGWARRPPTGGVAVPARVPIRAGGHRSEPVFVDAREAARLIDDRGAVVLDARGSKARAPYLPGARVISWLRFRDGWLRTGRLTDDLPETVARLTALGVGLGRPVLVYGDAAGGWGEEGRVWWMLAYLGHADVHILDGGVAAWLAGGLPSAASPGVSSGVARRDAAVWPPRPRAQLRAAPEDALALGTQILDVRTREEYEGATPHLSSRGGHIPGALHLEWKDLLDARGRLRPSGELVVLLERVGLRRHQPVFVYCTGGVRSAFVVAVLLQLGYDHAANYDGSWWEWAADRRWPVRTGPDP